MPHVANLRRIVESKSGAPLVSCGADSLRSQLGYDVASMRSGGFDPSIIAQHEAFNKQLEMVIGHPQLGKYLANLTPQEVYAASGVRVLTLAAIREEIQENAPGTRIFPHGYLPFATSIGGNAVCFHVPTRRVVWADHDSFGTDDITYKDRSNGTYRTVPFTPEQVAQAVVPLGEDFDLFIEDLINDNLAERLDELD